MTTKPTEPGVFGQYTGPQPGATPADDADLHDSGGNPYAAGSPASNRTGSSTYGAGADAVNRTAADNAQQTPYDVSAPYFANPPAAGGNPFAHTSAPSKSEPGDRTSADYVASGFDALYTHALDNLRGGSAPQPSASDVYRDEGYGPNGTGRS
jgi:hypothetical protein